VKDKKDFFGGITAKLSILMGGALLATGAHATSTTAPSMSAEPNGISMNAVGTSKPLPAKLTLKQQSAGFKLIAAHGSHSSHASHASHSSHSSRAS
jgi:hypothetical protein